MHFWFDVDPFPSIVFGSFGGTLFVVYAVLWAVIPEAKSASEKLEMRGEKVDLNTIKNTIQEDLEGFKARAEKWGGEMKDKAQEFGTEVGKTFNEKGKQFGSETGSAIRRGGSRIGRVIGIMFKAFFLFVAGVIAFALLVALLAIMVAGIGVFPLKNFFLEGFWQNFLAWTTLLLFFGVPVVAFITWLIRRIMGVKSGNRLIGFTFGGLWFIGLVCGCILAASLARDFDARAREKQDFTIQQPSTGKLVVDVPESKVKVYGRWFRMDGILGVNEDSIVLNNVRLRVAKSSDSLYHVSAYKYSNGPDESKALANVQQIHYGFDQQDSLITLDRGFSLQRGTRFRNQSVSVTLLVPVGKKVVIKGSVSRRLNYFSIHGRSDWDFDEDWNNDFQYWNSDVEYVMTATQGLKRVDKLDERKDDEDEHNSDAIEKYKKSKEELKKELERKQKEMDKLQKELDQPAPGTADTTNRYRYKKATAAKQVAEKEKHNNVAETDAALPAETNRMVLMQMTL